jgi:hypothetical protein
VKGAPTDMKYRPRQLDMTEMSWTFRHPLAASLTFQRSV